MNLFHVILLITVDPLRNNQLVYNIYYISRHAGVQLLSMSSILNMVYNFANLYFGEKIW